MKNTLQAVSCAAALLLGSACANGDVAGPGEAVPAASRDIETQTKMDMLAKGIALALRDSTLRAQIVEDMRDSPFPQHSLPLRAYLQGRRGQPLAATAATALKIGARDLSALLASLPEVAFQAATREDRATWTGTGAIVVAGSASSLEDRDPSTALTGYTPDGSTASVPLTVDPSAVVLTITPPRSSFGRDPEARRAAAPRQSRRTISTWDAEVGVQYMPCDYDCGEYGSPGYQVNPLQGLNLGADCDAYTMTVVDAGTDQDNDRKKDECEYRMAEAFRPLLVFHRGEALSGRESYWSVQSAFGWMTIIYLLGYYRDGGSFSHDGDSEFVVLRLEFDTNTQNWKVRSMITSAHWNAMVDNTKTSFWYDIQWESTPGGRPLVYASKDHHANYETESRCDARVGDECDPRSVGLLSNVLIYRDRNLGNSAHPFRLDSRVSNLPADCTMSKDNPLGHPGVECFFTTNTWSPEEGPRDDFSGWANKNTDTTHYSTVLSAYGML